MAMSQSQTCLVPTPNFIRFTSEEISTYFVSVDDVVSIFMTKSDGEKIARLVDNGTKVIMRITIGRQVPGFSNINKTSVLFVSISFIVLMIISLAWLVFYYIQRFRYAHAKERLSVRTHFINIFLLKAIHCVKDCYY